VRKILIKYIFLLLAQQALGQSRVSCPPMLDPVDSVSQIIDSLITTKAVFNFAISSGSYDDSSSCTRRYY
jgi:hypothetical protein